MGNEVALFGGSKLPAFARNREPSEIAKNLMGSAQGSDRISIKGGTFRLVIGGKEVAQIEERYLDVVIVNAAPKVNRVEVVIDEPARVVALDRLDDGLHEGFARGIGAGARYRYRLDGGGPFPDPASRFQPEGVHGPSEVIDPAAFAWTSCTSSFPSTLQRLGPDVVASPERKAGARVGSRPIAQK